MLNDFKRGFWYSIGAIIGVVTLQTLADRVIPEIAAKMKSKENNMEETEEF